MGEPVATKPTTPTTPTTPTKSTTPTNPSPHAQLPTRESTPWVADVTRLDADNVMVSFNISNERVLDLWANPSSGFSAFFNNVLSQNGGAVFFLQCAPMARASLCDDLFRFVLTKAPARLAARVASSDRYAGHFSASPSSDIVAFPNLDNTALLISPRKRDDMSSNHYLMLANFVRGAPQQQHAALWQCVAQQVRRAHRNGWGVVWVNTHGADVPWLHVRVDKTPKYYSYQQFK